MNQYDLTKLNIGEDLDSLMNLDPRGYGVCRILYKASREYTGAPLTMNFAEKLLSLVKENSIVYIISGFVLPPFGVPETDGIISSVLLCRALAKIGAKGVIVCPDGNLGAVKAMAPIAGLHLYENVDDVEKHPISMGVMTFPKDAGYSGAKSAKLLSYNPVAVIGIEAPGANDKGVYHNATGLDITDMQAKSDLFFETAKKAGVPTFAVGDLGNELGMGTIKEHLLKYIPYAQADGGETCRCGCNGGIAVKSAADTILTATVSDWGVYGVIAAMAWLKENIDIMHTPEMEHDIVIAASRAGMIDMYGWLNPAIDGQDVSICEAIVKLMRSCVENALSLTETCKPWFDKTLALGFFEGK